MTFSNLGLSQRVLDSVEASGYRNPTPIQAQAIPHVLARRDVLGIAQTGTGKTASFVLPMLTLLEQGRARARMPRTLILEPTRELAAQVEEHFNRYGRNHKLTVALIIGGVSFDDQLKKLDRGVDVLIATPGRLLDLFERGKILLSGVEILVIDEADRMLDMGFIPDIERICKMLPFTRQTLFFSATMPPEIQRLADTFLSNPVRVEVSRPASTAETVKQYVAPAGREAVDKRAVLRALIRNATDLTNAIIFCNRKRDVAIVHRSLARHGFSVGALHGDMDQRSRTQTLDDFRKDKLTLLVASDVAARGLDIPAVSHIFNFDVPTHSEDYVHRIGRTGRAGRSGVAVTIATPIDRKYVAAIEKLIGQPIEPMEIEAEAERAASFYGHRGEGHRGDKPDEHRPSGEERRGRRRGGRGDRQPRRANGAHAPEQAAASAEPAAPQHGRHRPAEGEKSEGHRRHERPQQHDRPQHERPQQHDRPQQQRPEGRRAHPSEPAAGDQQRRHRHGEKPAPRRHREPEPADATPGMGDHVPQFMLRPVRTGSS
jgi:superfamily II DNA/RNA helicase